jgi:hypothetical protein
LVASTACSRVISLRSRRPVTSSLAPAAYISAVSKNVTPNSMARRTSGSAAASSSTHSRREVSPKLIIPSASRDTCSPVVPKRT